jgi:tRNA threonylcarbamoyladenosine biosynthesis protein TsaE
LGVPEDRRRIPDEEAMLALGAELVRGLHPGDTVLLTGPLGAGKTTLVRGMLRGLGWQGTVRSPTFNLVQEFPTSPPVTHADLYRVESHRGLGIEEYLETHVVVIEWAERAGALVDPEDCWQVQIEPSDGERLVRIRPPKRLRQAETQSNGAE